MLPALAFSGVVFLDIDETRNRLVIGVSDPAAIRAVKNKAITSKIPQEAVVIEKAEPFHALKIGPTVNDASRPVIGGIQIQTASYIILPDNACLDGKKGFLTNSHCTDNQGKVDKDKFVQPLILPLDNTFLIGRELKDPEFASPLCPTSYEGCRYSDSAFVEYDTGYKILLLVS